MQINTKYHLKKFENLSQMIEPEENVKYAAIVSYQIYIKSINLGMKLSPRYHSSIPKKRKDI